MSFHICISSSFYHLHNHCFWDVTKLLHLLVPQLLNHVWVFKGCLVFMTSFMMFCFYDILFLWEPIYWKRIHTYTDIGSLTHLQSFSISASVYHVNHMHIFVMGYPSLSVSTRESMYRLGCVNLCSSCDVIVFCEVVNFCILTIFVLCLIFPL